MACRDFILPEPASYVFLHALFNLRKLLYLIAKRVRFGEEEQQNERALTFEKSRSKRYKACSDVEHRNTIDA
jgi:hypothetical protein